MSLEKDFQEAKQAVDSLVERPDNEELLQLYGLYKQAMFGDNFDEEPVGFDFKAIAKHRAWMENKGKSASDAMQEYSSFAHVLVDKYGG